MVDHNNTPPSNPDQVSTQTNRSGRRGMLVIALVAVALVAGLTGNMLSTAFGQGFAWHHFGMRDGGMFGGPLTPAQIDDRIDRMTKHMAIELDATADQQVKIANIAKAAIGDLLTLAEHAGRVMSRDALMDTVKGEPIEAFDRSIDVHVSRIRAAIEDDPKKPRRVITIRGTGYVFAKAQD